MEIPQSASSRADLNLNCIGNRLGSWGKSHGESKNKNPASGKLTDNYIDRSSSVTQ